MFHQIHHFSPCALLTVLLGLTMDVTSGMGSIQLIPQYPVINGSVTLSLTGITENFEYVAWHKGPNTDAQSQILSYFPGSASPLQRGRLYDTRFMAFNNGSLQIKDLRTTDGGDYTVKIQTDKQEDITGTLTVYESVTKPKITASSNQSKENDTFTLTCDTSTATMIRWTRRGSSISPNTKLSGDNKTLTFSSIKRNDSGEYQCEAQNLVSKDSSDLYKVTVAYGPDNVKIEGPLFVRPGSPITLSCSADSFPSPEYQWKVNDKVSEEKTNKYIIRNASNENQGLYMCVTKNTVTLLSAASTIYVNVTAEYIEPEKMDSTMFVGIVVAVLLLLILIIAIIYLFIIHKRRKSSSDTNSTLKDSSRNGQTDIPTQAAEQHELQYASIEFSKNMPRNDQKPEAIYENRSPQVAPPPTDNVVYSELKLR